MTTPCRDCGQPIFFQRTRSGRKRPVQSDHGRTRPHECSQNRRFQGTERIQVEPGFVPVEFGELRIATPDPRPPRPKLIRPYRSPRYDALSPADFLSTVPDADPSPA